MGSKNLQPGAVIKYFQSYCERYFKILSEEQIRMLEDGIKETSSLCKSSLLRLVLSELINFGVFEKLNVFLREITLKASSKDDNELLSYIIGKFEGHYGIQLVHFTITNFLVTNIGIRMETHQKILLESRQDESDRFKCEAFFSMLEHFGFIHSSENRYKLAKDDNLYPFLVEKYLKSEPQKQGAWEEYIKLLVTEIEESPQIQEMDARLVNELLRIYKELLSNGCVYSAHAHESSFVAHLGKQKIVEILKLTGNGLLDGICKEATEYNFGDIGALWRAILSCSKYAAAHLSVYLEAEKSIWALLEECLLKWVESPDKAGMEDMVDLVTVELIYIRLYSLASKLGKPKEEIEWYKKKISELKERMHQLRMKEHGILTPDPISEDT